jgi:type IV pilus assembly protein PilA
MRSLSRGFSMIELLLVILIIGILIAMTVPGLKETAMRKQVKEGLPLADVAKRGVETVYAVSGKMPANNADAGVPPPDKIISAMVTSVTVKDGAVTLLFGNSAGDSIKGKKLTLRPAIVPGYPTVPASWICADVDVPPKMELKGVDETDIPIAWRPVECRGTKK